MKFNNKITYLFFVLSIVLLTCMFILLYNESYLARDAAQYLSVAKNILNGNGFSTSLIYWDAHYKIGGVPVLQTVWPPGYPFLISLISIIGISPQYSAFLISLICFNLISFIIYKISKRLGYGQVTCLTLSGIWLFLVINWFNIFACLSEMAFTLMLLLSLGCVIQSEEQKEQSRRKIWILASGVFASLAFIIRYAGIFYLTGLLLFFIFLFFRNKKAKSFYDLIIVSIFPFLSVIMLFVRNYSLVGHFKGNTNRLQVGGVHLIDMLRNCYYILYEFFGFSKDGIINMHAPEILLIIFFLGILIFTIIILKKPNIYKFNFFNLLSRPSFFISLCYISITIIIILYFKQLVTGPRYFIPLIPFGLLLAAGFWHNLTHIKGIKEHRILKLFYVLFIIVFLFGQADVFLWSFKRLNNNNEYIKIRDSLQQPFGSYTLMDFLRDKINSDSPILGNKSQMLGAVLDRPVVGLTSGEFTDKIWSLDEVKKIIGRYNIRYILLLIDLFDKTDSNQQFLLELKSGNIPLWLAAAYSSESVALYEINTSILHQIGLEK